MAVAAVQIRRRMPVCPPSSQEFVGDVKKIIGIQMQGGSRRRARKLNPHRHPPPLWEHLLNLRRERRVWIV